MDVDPVLEGEGKVDVVEVECGLWEEKKRSHRDQSSLITSTQDGKDIDILENYLGLCWHTNQEMAYKHR